MILDFKSSTQGGTSMQLRYFTRYTDNRVVSDDLIDVSVKQNSCRYTIEHVNTEIEQGGNQIMQFFNSNLRNLFVF